jgi:transposase InsO family protein
MVKRNSDGQSSIRTRLDRRWFLRSGNDGWNLYCYLNADVCFLWGLFEWQMKTFYCSMVTLFCSLKTEFHTMLSTQYLVEPMFFLTPDTKTLLTWALYLAVVIGLYSQRVVGWSIQSRQTTDLVLQALPMAVWRRKPKNKVLSHSDQGSQFTSIDGVSFLKQHNLEHSMSRRGNCHDNAVAESFFNLLKRERVRRRIYKTRDDAEAGYIRLHRDVL